MKLRREIGSGTVAHILATKRACHLNPRFRKLLTKDELADGVMTCNTEDVFWDLAREMRA